MKAEKVKNRVRSSLPVRDPLGLKPQRLAGYVKKHLPVTKWGSGMNLQDRVKQLERHLSGVDTALGTIEQRLANLENLLQSAHPGAFESYSIHPPVTISVCIPSTSQLQSASVSDRATGSTGANVISTEGESQHYEGDLLTPKKIIVYHPNPWNEEEEDIPWEGTDDNIDPEIEQQLKNSGRWLLYELEKSEERRKRCSKLCASGHSCDEIHDPSLPCPPCRVLLQNYRMPCKHRVDVLCHQKRNLTRCPGCTVRLLNVWSSSSPNSTENLLVLLEAGFARLRTGTK